MAVGVEDRIDGGVGVEHNAHPETRHLAFRRLLVGEVVQDHYYPRVDEQDERDDDEADGCRRFSLSRKVRRTGRRCRRQGNRDRRGRNRGK